MSKEISKVYEPKEVEEKWYQYWEENDYFSSQVDQNKESYTIVIPPPNVTGILHMGHMLNNTIQDILIRKARMEGKEACWVPGTDHASIATETKVINKLAEQGIKKSDISREEFLKHAWEWKEEYGGIILKQLRKLGASCDWKRTKFTMDAPLSESVIQVFCDLYEKGLMYRGVRMVNWDPEGQTAVSDEEVLHKEVTSKLCYLKYKVEDSEEIITIATTRPETIFGDSAVCFNPEDERYAHLKGKKLIIPIVNRAIPIIFDEYVDKDFGTGALKVTPAHDVNDYNLGNKHQLATIDVLNDDGTLNAHAMHYEGKNRFVVRKEILKELEEKGLLEKIEEIKNSVGLSERTKAVIEPKLSMQWFCKMDELVKPALENVLNGNIGVNPNKFINMYRSWLENIKDWCVSRQLWWGQQIPAYYLPSGEFVVAKTKEEALAKAQSIDSNIKESDLTQDQDVLDTWFSSWLWPISVFDGIRNPNNEEINYYYPTQVVVSGFDIIFFWIARMVIAGYEFKDELPFKNIYITGMVRDPKGRKMSKSLGNSPDPLDLMDKYSTDGVRVGMLLSAPAGNDLLFDEKLCEQGRNFANKVWNAYRLIQPLEIDANKAFPIENKLAVEWLNSKFSQVTAQIEDHFSKFRISDALMSVYKFVYDDFCGLYLEVIKPPYGEKIDQESYDTTIDFFESLLKLLHPFMPFITEELWQSMKERTKEDALIIAEYPKANDYDQSILDKFTQIKEVISAVRNIRNNRGISPKECFNAFVKTNTPVNYDKADKLIMKLAGLSSFEITTNKPEGFTSVAVNADEVYIQLPEEDLSAKKGDMEKELKRLKGFLVGIEKKLSNERFVSNAPEQVIANEHKKKSDAEDKINTLEEMLASI